MTKKHRYSAEKREAIRATYLRVWQSSDMNDEKLDGIAHAMERSPRTLYDWRVSGAMRMPELRTFVALCSRVTLDDEPMVDVIARLDSMQ